MEKLRLLWSLSRHLSVNLWTGAIRAFWIWRENKATKVTDGNEACSNQVTSASWVYLFSVTPADIVAPCRVFSFACCLMKKGTVTLRERVFFYVRKILNFHSVSLKLNLNRSTLEPSRFSPLWCHKRSSYLTIAKNPQLDVGSSPSVVFNLLEGLAKHQFLEFFHDLLFEVSPLERNEQKNCKTRIMGTLNSSKNRVLYIAPSHF